MTNAIAADSARFESLQRLAAVLVALCWLVCLAWLLTTTGGKPQLEWVGPPHVTSSIVLAFVVSAVLVPYFPRFALLGWWTLVCSSVVVVAFECVQLFVPGRTFEVFDMVEGIAGAAIAAMVAAAFCSVVGGAVYRLVTTIGALLMIIVTPFLWSVAKPIPFLACDKAVIERADWSLQRFHQFIVNDELAIGSNAGALCVFTETANDRYPPENPVDPAVAATADAALQFNGGGLITPRLSGLRNALAATGELTFGLRFKPSRLQIEGPPRHVFALQSEGMPLRYLARVYHNGPGATATFSFGPSQGSSTVLANRLTDNWHELVLTYDGEMQRTYLDGVLLGTETSQLQPLPAEGPELVMNFGKRTDGHWKSYRGEIASVVIGASSVSAEEVSELFNR